MDFYQVHLDRVSRSFAFCIKQLRAPLRSWVSLTYLICRILDTLEDAPWLHKQQQFEMFGEFEKSLISPANSGLFSLKVLTLPDGISSGEKKLIKDSQMILSDLHNTPHKPKEIIQNMVRSMSLGMQFFLQKQEDGGLRLRSLSELNQYCFFVAGVVGEALSQLVSSVDDNFKLKRDLIIKSFHFGLFLQKINILKDQREDENEGRYFVPDRLQVYQSLVKNADNSFEYICEIPDQHQDYKLFCLWSFFLGMVSVSHIEKGTKISRIETWKLLDTIKQKQMDKRYLEDLYKKMRRNLESVCESFEGGRLSEDIGEKNMSFLECYVGRLSQDELRDLGLIA